MRSVLARRLRREGATEAASTTWLSMPSRASTRWSQKPSSPASWIHYHRKTRAGTCQSPGLEIREPAEQAADVAAAYGMARHLLAAPGREQGHQPSRPAELERDKDRAEVGTNRLGRAGKVRSKGHGHRHEKR